MHRTVVLNVVGLSPSILGEYSPRLTAFGEAGQMARIEQAFPAVTCTAQATYLTGQPPCNHGIVGNGWYFRDECEVKFWRQSNELVQRPKIWDFARAADPDFRCANLFWWYNMYSSVDFSVTPRPMYPADGRKIPDIYTHPRQLRHELQDELGRFPLFEFWGPGASIRSSQWIANAARRIEIDHEPTLSLVYLPHLDYGLQKWGPKSTEITAQIQEIDEVAGELIDFYSERSVRVIVLSEYGIAPVERPVHLNRMLRQEGLVAVREERGKELLDAGASAAFCVADHQVAHVYVNDIDQLGRVRTLVDQTPGVERVLGWPEKHVAGLDHHRSGEFIAVAEEDAWFSYYYWLDDDRAPDFARTVDIHRKPGYDPVELFIDPELRFSKLRIAKNVIKKKLGFRYLMDIISLDASLVRGSHGRANTAAQFEPMLLSNQPELVGDTSLGAGNVFNVIARHLGLHPGEISRSAQ